MKRKNNVGLVIIIMLMIIILGLCSYIAYDKGLLFNNSETDEQEKIDLPSNENTENYDYVEISDLLNEKLSEFFKYRAYNKNDIDLLSIVDLRLELINYLFVQSNDVQIYDDGIIQPFPYVSYDKYSSKYNEVYGKNYSLENDLLNVSSGMIANQRLGSNNISWNGTWGSSGISYVLTAQNITYDSENSIYTLSGIYTQRDESDNSFVNGKFSIKYTQKDDIKNLKSIILTQSN